jgi:hypothetical protein
VRQVAILSILAASVLLAAAGTARADVEDDHLFVFALQQGLVGGQAVKGCSSEFPSSTATAVGGW